MKLSRRDRAAMALAYEHLRYGTSTEHIWGVDASVIEAARSMRMTRFARAMERMPLDGREMRILRVRLALLLRVLLRASAGDYGQSRYPYERSGPLYPRYRPLWEQARRHE